MKRFIACAGIALTFLVFCASQAEARIFEPQRNWWTSARTCIESRNPAGLAWDGLPARACVERPDGVGRKPRPEALGKDYSPLGAEVSAEASADQGVADKFTAKI